MVKFEKYVDSLWFACARALLRSVPAENPGEKARAHESAILWILGASLSFVCLHFHILQWKIVKLFNLKNSAKFCLFCECARRSCVRGIIGIAAHRDTGFLWAGLLLVKVQSSRSSRLWKWMVSVVLGGQYDDDDDSEEGLRSVFLLFSFFF